MPAAPTSLRETYLRLVLPTLKKEFGYKNDLAAPRLRKVVLNIGLSTGKRDAKFAETARATLTRITGQKPVMTLAKRSISNFKIREAQEVGCTVTLRGSRMYDFLEKFVRIGLPRIRDFRGLPSSSLDQQGNLALGLREHIVFPEIRTDEVESVHGLELAIATTANRRDVGKRLFQLLGFPFAD